MTALFPAGGMTIIYMMSTLEVGKLVATGWLHANFRKREVSKALKAYMVAAVVVLMALTSIGIFGFLSKSHLEGEAPVAGVEIKITQIQQRIDQTQADRGRLEERRKQLDAQISSLLSNSKSAKDAAAAQKLQVAQKKEREQLQTAMDAKDTQINTLSDSLAPLKLQISDVSAKLGPMKYVANLFGWKDTSTAVQMIILIIMSVFDPLAVFMLLSSQFSLEEAGNKRREKKEKIAAAKLATLPAVEPPQATLPKVEPRKVILSDLSPLLLVQDEPAPNDVLIFETTPKAVTEEPETAPAPVPIEPNLRSSPELDPVAKQQHFHEETLETTQNAAELAALAERKAKLYDEPEEQGIGVKIAPARVVMVPDEPIATPVTQMRSTILGTVLPDHTVTGQPTTAYGAAAPFQAAVSLGPSTLTDDPTSFFTKGFEPKNDRERLLELLGRRPDILEQVVNIVEEDIKAEVQHRPVPTNSLFPAPEAHQPNATWMNEPFEPTTK